MLPRLSAFKQYLVLEIWDKDQKTLPLVLKEVDEFLASDEGMKKFHEWQWVNYRDQEPQIGPKPIMPAFSRAWDILDPISKQGLNKEEGW